MGLSVYAGPSVDPISLAEAKDHLRETSSEQDGLIAGYVMAAREFVENATNRKLITQTLDYTIDQDWPCVVVGSYYRHRIDLPVSPVASVSSITYVDTSGVTQTLASNQYAVVVNGPFPFIEPAYGVTWPAVRDQSSAITVRFIAGTALSGVPNPLMQAMRMLIGHWYNIREAVNVGSIPTEIPLGVEALISGYRDTRIS